MSRSLTSVAFNISSLFVIIWLILVIISRIVSGSAAFGSFSESSPDSISSLHRTVGQAQRNDQI